MKNFSAIAIWGCLLIITQQLSATPIAYISAAGEPWNQSGNINAMDNVFGSGNWDRLSFSSAVGDGIFTAGYEYLYVDGGNGRTGWQGFMDANRTALESFVAAGGNLFLNAGRWGGTPEFDLGFGATLNFGSSFSGYAADPDHAIFTGPMGATGAGFVGSWFSHDYVTGAGLNAIIADSLDRAILAEMAYGEGHVMFGGLPLSFYGEHPYFSATTGILRDNIIAYGNSSVADSLVRITSVSEPGAIALLGVGLLGIGLVRRRI